MKKLLCVFLFSSAFLLGSEHDAGYTYTKNTCHRTWYSDYLSTDKEREEHYECRYSRFEAYDNDVKKYVAHIAYNPSKCFIEFLRVDDDYQRQGIGRRLAIKAMDDMRKNYDCRDISLDSTSKGRKFWESLGGKLINNSIYVFSDPSVAPLLTGKE